MILALNLNCSLDKIYTVPALPHGGVVRALRTSNTAGGKGLHVANICSILGEDYTATGFLGGHTGAMIADILREKGIRQDFVKIAGETRACINIGTPDGMQTEVLEAGPAVSPAEADAFRSKYRALLPQADVVVGSGSLPQGLPQSFYGELIALARTAGKRFLLDTSGGTLAESLAAQPFLIKPNRDEIEALTGRRIHTPEEAAREVRAFMERGIALPIVSLGAAGSVAGWQGHIYRVQPPQLHAVNAVGSGDAFVAGIAVGLRRGYGIEELLRFASACGAANVLEAESGVVDPNKVREIFAQVRAEEQK